MRPKTWHTPETEFARRHFRLSSLQGGSEAARALAPLPRPRPGTRRLRAPGDVGLRRPGGRACLEKARPGRPERRLAGSPPVRPSPAEPAASQSSPPAPRPARRPHHHHQGLAVHRREPPATSPAAELQGGRHLAGADLLTRKYSCRPLSCTWSGGGGTRSRD